MIAVVRVATLAAQSGFPFDDSSCSLMLPDFGKMTVWDSMRELQLAAAAI